MAFDDATPAVPRPIYLPGNGVVFAGGCFDWMHWAHIDFLQRARELGTSLIVGLNSDESIRRLKGSRRPIIGYDERRRSLLALRCVDGIVPIEDDLPLKAIRLVRPAIVVKGPGYDAESMPERELIESLGGRIVILPGPAGVSTTELLKRAANGTSTFDAGR